MIIDVEFDPEDVTIEEAIVSMWYVDEGETVDENDVLVELVAEGETIEVRSPSAGTIVELRVEEDETVKAGDPLCVLDTENVMDYAADEDEEEDEDEDAL